MFRLTGAIVGLLADMITYWAIPIVGTALFSVLASIVIAINPFVGALVILIVAALLVIYCLREEAVWQAILWGSLLVPYSIVALTSPPWAIIWGLGISLTAIGVLAIPGVVLPHSRVLLTTALTAAIGLHTVLAFTVWSQGIVFLTVIGLLALMAGIAMFSRGARPWELRHIQRQVGRLTVLGGLVFIVVGIIAPRLSLPTLAISASQPVVSVWETIVNHTEKWAFSSQRSLIGERAKTHSLKELEPELRQAYRERWEKNIQKIPDAPLTPEEWRELGVSDP